MRPVFLALGIAFASLVVEAQPRLLGIDDLHRVADLAEPAFSPDGGKLLYSVSAHDLDRDSSVSDLWLVDTRTRKRAALMVTPGRSEHGARWRPDGRAIAFLGETGDEELDQVFIVDADGRNERALPAFGGGVWDFDWSPDGRRLLVLAEDALPSGGKDSNGKVRPRPPIEIDRFQFKEDNRGYLEGQRLRVWLLDIASGARELLTPGPYDAWYPRWSPDGRRFAFVSKRDGDPDRNLNFDVFVMDAKAGATPRRVSTAKGADNDPTWESPPDWSRDGRRLAWLTAGEDKWVYYTPWQLSTADPDSGTVATPARIDRSFYHPRWAPDGRHLYALIEQDRVTLLARIDAGNGEIAYLSHGKRFAYDFDVAADGRVALLDGSDTEPYTLSIVAPDGSRTLLADHNTWRSDVALQEAEDITWTSFDGTPIHGMLLRPAGRPAGKPAPTIVRVHGGPVYQYSHEFMFDWQYYAASGFAVLAVNPRGSSGRGFEFARAIYAAWGDVDARDVQAGVDHLVKTGVSDPTRLGVGGWSYGGILTNSLIASDTRFGAAVSGAGSAHATALYGTDQYSREYELELGVPWRDRAAYERNSAPLLQAGRIRTPTLFQCAELDFNVPCIGGEQMYQALRSIGVPTRLVIYPAEYHGLTVPSYLRHRLEQSLAWYREHLQPATATAKEK